MEGPEKKRIPNKKEERAIILETFKKRLTIDFILNEYNFEKEEHGIKTLKDAFAYWVDFSARAITKAYFRKINKKYTKKEFEKVLIEIKKFYYENKKNKKDNPPKDNQLKIDF